MTNYLNKELPQYGQENGVTKRCVEKDIEYLEYKFPILIEFDRYSVDAHSVKSDKVYKKRCIRYADPTFSIFKGKLTDEEKGLLTVALSTIGSFDGLDRFGWIDELNKRLGLVEQQPIVLMSKNVKDNENKTFMAELFSAIRARSVIQIEYKLFNTSEVREVILSPYLLKEYNQRWYLIAGADDTGNILNFALDRIVSIKMLPGYEYRLPQKDLSERFEDIIGVTYYEGALVHKIICWTSDKSAPYIQTKPMHSSYTPITGEREIAIRAKHIVPSGGALFSLECMENYELIRELCSFGGDLKVISPQPIVNAVKHRIKSMAEIYDM
jgi:predicted DNA-binding transcriptional regulator YafY